VAAVLADLLDDPARARAMGAAGRAWVEQRWSWTTIAQTFARVLEG
jgi:phosphatidylinositol alpha-1,6-mannosyltransferase